MKKTIRILMMAMVAAAMMFAFAACGGDDGDEYADEDEYQYIAESIENGTSLGTFTSTDLDGNEVTDAIFSEMDVTVLNVWGTYCDPCKEEMPELAEWDKELPDNVQIVGVILDVPDGDTEMIETAKKICKKTGVTYTNILYNESVDEMLASVEAIPTTFILDKEGKTIFTPIVGADVDAYKDAVQDYLENGNQ